ncbi:MAG: TonB-dependent copper receptor [Janthinobacterium lividum]
MNRLRLTRGRRFAAAAPLLLPACGYAALAPVTVAAVSVDAVANAVPANDRPLQPVVVTSATPSGPLTVVTDPKAPRLPLPASDGADYLKTIPGFAAIRNGGTNGDPVLRGMFGSRLSILTNGTDLQGACPGRMDAPTSYISPTTYDKLTVIKGPESVIYGPGASAGTILFERLTPRFTDGGTRFTGALTGGSNGRNDQSADFTAGTPDVYGRVIVNHAHAQDYRDGSGTRVASQWDKSSVDTALGLTPDARTLLELTAGTSDGYARYAARGMDGIHFRRDSVSLKFDKHFIDQLVERVQAQVYFNRADHLMDNYTLRHPDASSMMPMAMASDVRRSTAGTRVAATLNLRDDLRLIAGIDARASRLDQRSGTATHNYGKQPWKSAALLSDIGVFGELTWYLAPRYRLIAGVRLDAAQAQDKRPSGRAKPMAMHGMHKMGGMHEMHGGDRGANVDRTAGDRRRALLPSGFMRYEHDLASLPATLYVGLGHSERFPDYWELFSPGSGPVGAPNAFAGVRPEKTTQLDFGAQYRRADMNAWVSAYLGEVKDFILFDYLGAGMHASTRASNVNARIAGGEAGVALPLTRHWRIDTSLAYAWAQNTDAHQPLPQIPPLEGRITLAYAQGPFGASALWRIVAPQHRYARNAGNVVGRDLGPSGGFGVLALSASYVINKQARVVAGIDNLLNKTYAEHLNLAGNAGFGYPADLRINEPGRTIWAQMNVDF